MSPSVIGGRPLPGSGAVVVWVVVVVLLVGVLVTVPDGLLAG
jgi:hypothetical protein